MYRNCRRTAFFLDNFPVLFPSWRLQLWRTGGLPEIMNKEANTMAQIIYGVHSRIQKRTKTRTGSASRSPEFHAGRERLLWISSAARISTDAVRSCCAGCARAMCSWSTIDRLNYEEILNQWRIITKDKRVGHRRARHAAARHKKTNRRDPDRHAFDRPRSADSSLRGADGARNIRQRQGRASRRP